MQHRKSALQNAEMGVVSESSPLSLLSHKTEFERSQTASTLYMYTKCLSNAEYNTPLLYSASDSVRAALGLPRI